MRIAIAYNEPCESRYDTCGEQKAVTGVLDAVEAVRAALTELGYNVVQLSLSPPLTSIKSKLEESKIDIVFNLFEGFCGYPETEAELPELLETIGIPYTGCTPYVLRLALDKARTKEILKAEGIPTPDFQLIDPETVQTFKLRFPCIVKPRGEDASHGLTEESVVNDYTSMAKQVKKISEHYGREVLVEEFLDGQEFNATVMGNNECIVLPVSEIIYSLPPGMPRILTFSSKWESGSIYYEGTKAVCPAQIPPEEYQRVANTALRTFQTLKCHGYARVDMRMDRQRQINVIEVNPNPDISPGYGAARQAETAGMNYTRLIEKILQLASQRALCR